MDGRRRGSSRGEFAGFKRGVDASWNDGKERGAGGGDVVASSVAGLDFEVGPGHAREKSGGDGEDAVALLSSSEEEVQEGEAIGTESTGEVEIMGVFGGTEDADNRGAFSGCSFGDEGERAVGGEILELDGQLEMEVVTRATSCASVLTAAEKLEEGRREWVLKALEPEGGRVFSSIRAGRGDVVGGGEHIHEGDGLGGKIGGGGWGWGGAMRGVEEEAGSGDGEGRRNWK